MADNQTKVSNGYLSNNPDFDVADDLVGTKRYQQVKLIDSTGGSTTPVGTAANPLHVQGTAVGGDVNIAEVGGTAVTDSVPVSLKTPHDGMPLIQILSSTFVDTGCTTTVINLAGSTATLKAGDWILFDSLGDLSLRQVTRKIASINSGTQFTLEAALPSAPTSGIDRLTVHRPYYVPTSNGVPSVAITSSITLPVSSGELTELGDAIAAISNSGATVSKAIQIGGDDPYAFDGPLFAAPNVTSSALSGNEYGVVTRTIPSGTQTISGTVTANCRDGAGNALVSTTTNPDTTDRGLITKAVCHASDGGAGTTSPLVMGTDTPNLFDTGLVTRSLLYTTDGVGNYRVASDTSGRLNINSRTQDTSGNGIASATGAPTSAQRGLIVRNIAYNYDSGTLAHFRTEGNSLYGTTYTTEKSATGVSKSFNTGNADTGTTRVVLAANQPTVRDSSGNAVASATTTPGASDRGLTTRSFAYLNDANGVKLTAETDEFAYDAAGLGVRTVSDVFINSAQPGALVAPHGYYYYSSRTTTTGSTTTVINTTTDPSTACRRGDKIRIASGTHAEGIYLEGVVSSVNSSSITLQFPLLVAPPTGRQVNIYKPFSFSVDYQGYLNCNANQAAAYQVYPVYANKFFSEGGALGFASISGTYATIYTTSQQTAVITVTNATDVTLTFSFDSGSGDAVTLASGQTYTLAAIQNGGYIDGSVDIQVRDEGTAASTGLVRATGYYF